MKNHLHTYLNFDKGGSVRVALDIPANVYLMDDTAYQAYQAGEEFKAVGGYVRARTKTLKAPAVGNWHLVIDSRNPADSVSVSLQLTGGRAINQAGEEPQLSQPGDTETEQILSAAELAAKRRELSKDLAKMIKQIDMEGLLFLMKQASVLLHNQQVKELNKKITSYNQTLSAQKQGKRKKTDQSGTPEAVPVLVDLKENTENSFILVLNGVRKVLSRQELREILRICHARTTDPVFAAGLYKWLKDRRTDILLDAGIRKSSHPLLLTLRSFLTSQYKARQD